MINSQGDTRLYLPYNFYGPIKITIIQGVVRISNALSKSLTILHGHDNSKQSKNFIFFQGDISQWLDSGDSWMEDEVIVEHSQGNFEISYDDEVDDWY